MLDALVSAALLGGGVGLWRQRLAGPALLSAGTGLAWLLGDLNWALVFLHRGPLVQLLLAYPRGVPRSRGAQAVLAAGYVDALAYPLGSSDLVTVALLGGVVTAASHRYLRSSGVDRRSRRVPLLAVTAVAAVLMVGATARWAGHPMDLAVLNAYEVVLIGVPIALYTDARWGRWPSAALARLVVDLGETATATPLREKLAAALGDPSLVVGYT